MGFFLPVDAGSWSFCLSPSLRDVDSSLGLGKVHSPVFVGPFAFSFFFPLRSFRQILGVIPFR